MQTSVISPFTLREKLALSELCTRAYFAPMERRRGEGRVNTGMHRFIAALGNIWMYTVERTEKPDVIIFFFFNYKWMFAFTSSLSKLAFHMALESLIYSFCGYNKKCIFSASLSGSSIFCWIY